MDQQPLSPDHLPQTEEMEYYKQLFLLSNDLVCLVANDGSFRRVNPAFTKVLGWSPDELINKIVFEITHPDDIASSMEQLKGLNEGIDTVNFVHRLRKADGDYVWLQWMATPDPSTGYIFAIGRDITELVSKENKLQESEHQFHTFFRNSKGMMCMHDLEGKLLDVNLASAESLGYQPEELIGRTLWDIVPPDFAEGIHQYLKAIKRDIQTTGIMRTMHRNGDVRIWLFNNVLEYSLDGKGYVIGNALDITERHALEKDLKWTKEILEQTNSVANIGFWQYDIANHSAYWSDVTRRIHEVGADFVPGLESALSFYKINEERVKLENAVEMAIKSGVPWDLELELATAKGRDICVRAIGTAEMNKGVCTRLYGTFQDITDKKRAERLLLEEKAKLSAFVEHIPAAVAMLDKNLKFIAYSNAWLEGYQLQGQQVYGRSVYEVFPEIEDEFKQIHQNSLHGKVEKNEDVIWRPKGAEQDRHLRWEIRPWYQHDGVIGGITVLTEDITEKFTQQEELRSAKKLAELASVAKSEFLANMSHEIRTPLNGIVGFTDLVLKSNLNEIQHQYISIVNQSAGTLMNIINDILDFSKIEAGKLELDISKVDLYEISGQVSDMVKYQAQSKGLEMLYDISPALPRFTWIDPLRLKQIMVNLLSNAVKFTESGEVGLKIYPVSPVDATGKLKMRFEVSDTGIGIKPERQHKIFEAFSQEDVSITKRYGGTGLGLTISNKLLALMDSQLQLDSSVGKGSTFYFEICAGTEEGIPVNWENIDTIKKVLITDDNEHNRIILQQMLLLKGIDADIAKNGFEAIQLLMKGKQYDALVMDYHMPVMDGLETIRKIREISAQRGRWYPVVFLYSSFDDELVIRECDELKVEQRLVKPVKMEELYHALSRLYKTAQELPESVVEPSVSQLHESELTLLIAEDNSVNMLLAKIILGRILPHARLLEAKTGLEAVALYKKELPDLVLMDIQMPEMDGYDATKKIRELYPERATPVIAITAANVKGERERCLDAGMDDFLSKPFIENEILSILEKWIEHQHPDEKQQEQAEMTAPIDISVLMSYLGSPDATDPLITKTLELLLEECTDVKEEFKNKNVGSNIIRLKEICHSMHGVAGYTGLNVLDNIIREIESGEASQKQLDRFLAELDKCIVSITLALDARL